MRTVGTVWVAVVGVDYEFERIVGVYTSRQAAVAAADARLAVEVADYEEPPDAPSWHGDTARIFSSDWFAFVQPFTVDAAA